MSCNKPLVRAETYSRYTNKQGGISYKCDWINRDEFDKFGSSYLQNKYRRIDLVGCGQCVECRLQYSRDKATQMMLEKKFGYNGGEYPDGTCWFVTCTYADEYLKTSHTVDIETGELFEGVSLDKHDHQTFIKRIRKELPDIKIKYVVAGEYGSQTLRPHYHYIFFGLPLDQTQFVKTGINDMGQPTWKNDWLTKKWGLGHVTIGRVDWRSCAYVARYTLKKAYGKEKNWYYAQGMEPEFICWSNNVGHDYFKEKYQTIYQTDSVPVLNNKSGANVKPPKSYDRMLKEIDPKLYEKVKRIRTQSAESTEIQLRLQTDLTPEERRLMQEARMQQVMKDIRTEV